jgi:hypothetical protein
MTVLESLYVSAGSLAEAIIYLGQYDKVLNKGI